jgi:protein SCO1/2
MACSGALAAAAMLSVSTTAQAQLLADELPAELDGVGIVQRLNQNVPMDLSFRDSEGREVQLKDLARPGRPLILTLNYYRCPMLCSITLNGLIDGLREMEWTVGDEFDIVTVSINPDEDASLAAQNKTGYLAQYGRDEAGDGWHFLVGDQEEIETLAKAVGFGYRFDEKSGEYAHTSSIMFLTPDGVISKYMNDVRFKPRDLRFALIEASEGGVGTPIDTLLLFNCFQWDPETGAYVADAWKIMRLGGVITIIVLAIGIVVLAAKGPKHRGPHGQAPSDGYQWHGGDSVGGEA